MKNLLGIFMCITLSAMVMLSACGLASSYSHKSDQLLECETDMECELETGISY